MADSRRKSAMAGSGERGILNVSRRAGRGKNRPPWGHIIVNRRKIVTERASP